MQQEEEPRKQRPVGGRNQKRVVVKLRGPKNATEKLQEVPDGNAVHSNVLVLAAASSLCPHKRLLGTLAGDDNAGDPEKVYGHCGM